jgi:membrane-associated phospholipid phosphatase
MSPVMRLWLPLCAALFCTACGTLSNGRTWAQDATYRPGWERVRQSAVHALRDPWVWVPLVGTSLFLIDDWDREASDWAREHTPIFGSQQSAEDWSDGLKTASAVAFNVSALATPSGGEPSDWVMDKARGYLVEGAAIWLTSRSTQALKAATDRERPNGQALESFPSGHTSASAVFTQLASRNLRSIEVASGVRRGLDYGLDALTLGTSWARIEAGWHFPSDTLFGMALGNFLGAFIHDAFLGLESDSSMRIGLAVGAEHAELQVQFRF